MAELNKMPPERHEVERLPGTGGEPLLCPVIKIGVDEVLLNHQSHRIRAQLNDDLDWRELGKDPWSAAAQKVVERHVRNARKEVEFNALKDSLVREGQTAPGVLTAEGVLVNANTRVVALRELEDPARRYVRVAVLPESTGPEELALLELRLQMTKELKVDYSLSNELLFIEELSSVRKLTDAQIARELRIFPESERKGKAEVRQRLRLLDLLRTLQNVPAEPLPLTFFDARISYEQLRELDRVYSPLVESAPAQARMQLESFLLSVSVGVTPVHQLRRIDEDFMGRYMLPHLEEDEIVGQAASRLSRTERDSAVSPRGVAALRVPVEDSHAEDVNIKKLLDVVTQSDHRVAVPGTPLVLEREDVKEAVKAAIITGIRDKRRDDAAEDKQEAPLDALKSATRNLNTCLEALQSMPEDLDSARKKSLEAAFKRHKRTLRTLDERLAKAGIITN